ncbi:bacteriophage Gp15 family protein [Lacticaseibacillus parakribbianus]|uniref:bacteriophage Gp15 family protein n=1 Tax=Lacticaseibacillus parakribbianus TaxID=2970927 RepID=UPI0021CB96B9|nr:bacteriophage Gp15 family protein [Lacticaseibacillus parakribbianus]
MDLTGKNENQITVDGVTYQLNLGYAVVLEVFRILADDGLSAQEHVELVTRLLVRGSASVAPAARDGLLQAIMDEKIDLAENRLAASIFKAKGKAFDFDADASRIAASFMQQYHIDLTNARERAKLSWAFFNALLDGLGPDTPFRQATAYRMMEIPKDATDEQRDHILKMKKLYSLKTSTAKPGSIEAQMIGLDRLQRIKLLARMKKEGDMNG